jgi:sporulation related protein
MADDTYSRGYRNDRHDRGGASDSGPATDPLTELARLIGQSDPFAPGRKRQPDQGPEHQRPEHYPQAYDTGAHDDRYGAASEPQHYADPAQGAEGYADYQNNGYAYPQAAQHEAGYGDAPGYEQQPYYQDQQAYQSDQQSYQQDEQAYHHEQQAYRQDPPPYARSEPSYLAQPHAAPAHGHGAHGEEGGEAAFGPYDDAQPNPANPGYPAPPPFFGDPSYDDAPAPRRGWLVTAAALVGLAVVGTAGAMAYRAVFTGSETRIITRDVGPSKVAPTQTSQDNATKPSDRLAAAGQNERLGPPPEQPMPIPEPPRTAPPAIGQGQVPAQVVATPPPPGAAAPPMDPAGPPRIVRTERIKPNEQPADALAPRPPAPRGGGQQAAVQPPQPRVAPPPANAPLSLAPADSAAPAQAPAPAPAPAPPPHTTALATPPAAAERNGAGGSGYYVQVSAQKSEDEAKSSFRGIQARHASLLGGQQLVVRRKDLGSKGVFYGAQVGPLSREAAGKLCEDLKAAGQSCMVQKN